MWNLIFFFERYKWTYLQNIKKLINIENNLVVTEEETWDWGWGGGESEAWD